MSGREQPCPPSTPKYAWGSERNQIREESSGQQNQRANLLTLAHSESWPRPADSSTSSVSSESEVKEALYFIQKFLLIGYQDSSRKTRFLKSIDTICSTVPQKGENFKDDLDSGYLIGEVLQFLLPEASSPNDREREMTLARMTRLIDCIPNHAISKKGIDLKLGQLAGCFTLCCSDPCEEVCLWAADGLHHLYTLVMQRTCKTLAADSQKYHDLMKDWEEEKIFWLALFSDPGDATRVFKRWLSEDEQTDFILMAIKGMREDNIHNTSCSVRMLRTMLKNPEPQLVNASKAIQLTYQHLEDISDNQARQLIFYYLRQLGNAYPDEVGKTLLGCSIQCDSTSAAMWHALTSAPDPAMKILTTLQTILLEQPLSPEDLDEKAALNPLAATSALYEILGHPSPACNEVLQEMYPTLALALMCQISYTVHFMAKETEIYWLACIQQQTPTPLVPSRLALKTFEALLQWASNGDEDLMKEKMSGSELLINPTTHQKGLYFFARAIAKHDDSASILPYLLDILDDPEDFRHVPAMTFLVELLRHQHFENIRITEQLQKQLKAAQVQLRSLALDGMVHLSACPKQMAKLVPAVPEIMESLKEPNRAINRRALKVLRCLLTCLEEQELRPFAVDVAKQVIPLFEDGFHRVRKEAIHAFNIAFNIIKEEDNRTLKKIARETLVPLMAHLNDNSFAVTQVSRIGLEKIDRFLKSFFQKNIEEVEKGMFCRKLLERYRNKINVDQVFFYLENPQNSIRDAAVRMLEVIAKGSRNKDTIRIIATTLSRVRQEHESMARESSSETMPRGCCWRLQEFWRSWRRGRVAPVGSATQP